MGRECQPKRATLGNQAPPWYTSFSNRGGNWAGEAFSLILHGRITEQVIDRGERGEFRKEILVTPGAVPLAIVRKRWAGIPQEVRRAKRGGIGADLPAVLLVHGFGQNRYAWHLPSRSLANHLARAGFDVFNLDLRGHGRSRALGGKRSVGIFDYVDEDLPAAVREVQRHVGGRRVFLVGHSLGKYEAELPSPPFARLSRSLMVNLKHVHELKTTSRDEAQLFLRGLSEPLQVRRLAAARLRELLK